MNNTELRTSLIRNRQILTNDSKPKSSKLDKVQKWTLRYIKQCNELGIPVNDYALGVYLNLKGYKSAVVEKDKEYIHLKAYSNSKLSKLLDKFLGYTEQPKPYPAFGMGSVVHQQILEPEVCNLDQYLLTPAKERDIKGMINSLKRDRGVQYALKHGEKEVVVIWNDKATNAPCKGKLDMRTKTTVSDIKTTGARSKDEFTKAIFKYGYDRQAAMYLDGSNKQTFKFIAVQKFAPYNVFSVSFHRNDPEIKAARKKYQFIIKKALEAGL